MPLWFVGIGCGRAPGQPNSYQQPIRPDEVLDFAALCAENCAACHGVNGRGAPAPPLHDPVFLAIVPDKVLHDVIERGRPGTLMPAFGDKYGGALTTEQVKILTDGIRTKWGQEKPKLSAPLPQYLAGKTMGDAKRGANTFQTACASCHGKDGKGGDAGPIHEPAFLALLSDQALRRIIITGRPDLKMRMPNFAERGDRPKSFTPLTDQDVADLVALLAEWRQGR